MCINLDKPITINDSLKYIIVSYHRNRASRKSYWIISKTDELNSFKKTITMKWVEEYEGWGLKLLSETIQVLGKNSYGEDLKIAKYVDGSKNNIWHGYPADYMRNINDRPVEKVLLDWRNKGYICIPSNLKAQKK